MDAIEVRVDNVNLIEVEFEPGQNDIEIAANFNPVIEVKEFDYPQELVLVNQRISQILQTEGRLVEWNKSATHIQYRYAGDAEWVDLVALSEIKGIQGERGLQGEKGEQGERGLQGIQGEQGLKGDQGDIGLQGEKGEQGDRGLQGIQGEQGLKGDKGDPQTRDGLELGIDDSPEFADTQITPLKDVTSAGEIPDSEWTWLGVIAENKKKVLKVLKAIISNIYAHQNTSDIHSGVIADYTVTEDVVMLHINVNILPDKPFTIYIFSPLGYEGTSLFLRVNDIVTSNYQVASAAYTQFVVYSNNSYFNGILDMILFRGNVIIGGAYTRASTVPAYTGGVYSECTFGLSLPGITKLTFLRATTAVIKAGTRILIRYK